MNKYRFIILIAICFGFLKGMAQQKELKGSITNSFDVEGIHVLNTTSRINTVTDQNGDFVISARVSDTLYISSIKYLPKKIVVSLDDYQTGILTIALEELVNELDEVFLGPNLTGNIETDLKNIKTEEEFNFDDVGIPGFKGKPEEKIVPIVPGIGLVTAVDLEAMYKHISGYYKKLKKQRKWDAQNIDAVKIINFYTAQFFTEAYKVPEDRLYDFMLFCIESSELQADFNNENFNGVLAIFEEKSAEYVSRLPIETEKE